MKPTMNSMTWTLAVAGLGLSISFLACGNKDKPPLTPDTVETEIDSGVPDMPPPPSSAAPVVPSAPVLPTK